MRNIRVIDYSEAKKIIDLIVDKAAQMQKSVVVAVADSHGELIAFARMDGAPFSSIRIAANKAYTAARELLRRLQIRWLGRRHSPLEGWRRGRRRRSQRPFLGRRHRVSHARGGTDRRPETSLKTQPKMVN
jgi:hypothetical protein